MEIKFIITRIVSEAKEDKKIYLSEELLFDGNLTISTAVKFNTYPECEIILERIHLEGKIIDKNTRICQIEKIFVV